MDSSEVGTCSVQAQGQGHGQVVSTALSPVRHGKGPWASSSREHPWIIYLGLPVHHYILVTPTSQGLNPNANVFESKLSSGSTSWEDGTQEAEHTSASISLVDDSPLVMAGYHHQQREGQQYANGGEVSDDPDGLGGGMVVLPSTSAAASCSSSPGPPSSRDLTAVPPLAEGDREAVTMLNAEDQRQQRYQQTPASQAVDSTIPQDQLKAMLQQQLEYYFSRENLANDTYLLSQMDSDQYVPIWTVANFNQIKKLTKDLTLIVEVLRDSPNVQVDEAGEKVRPNHKRCIVILREIPDSTPVEEVEALFGGENCPKFVSCEFAHNNSWYVTFESDEDAQRAYRYLREEVKCFQGKSIMARIKAKPITRASFLPKNGYRPSTVDPNSYPQQRFAAFQPAAIPSVGYGGQQVPALYAFPPFYPPSMLQTWAPTSHAYFDIGSVFSINGLSPQPAFKPLNGSGRSNYQLLRPRNQKSHLRNQSNYERLDSRSGSGHGAAGPPTNGFAGGSQKGGAKPTSGGDNGHAKREAGQTSSAATSSPGTEALQSPASSLGTEGREDALGQGPFNQAESQMAAGGMQPARQESRHRRRKKEDEGEVSKSTVATKDVKAPLPKFDLEAAAFPPLPGTMDAGNADSEAFENRMSDVVRGTARPPTRDSKTQTSAPLSPVAHPTDRERAAAPLTNGDDPAFGLAVTPPLSPTWVAEAGSCPVDTRTGETERKDEAASPTPAVTDTIKITIPTCPTPTSCKGSPPPPPPPTAASSSPNVSSAAASPNSISHEDKTARLSYAQMAQRAKEKVEKMAQEQKERQGALDRERCHVKDSRNPRERDVPAKGGQRDRYQADVKDRFRRSKMSKETPNVTAAEDRPARRDRDQLSKLPTQGNVWTAAPQQAVD